MTTYAVTFDGGGTVTKDGEVIATYSDPTPGRRGRKLAAIAKASGTDVRNTFTLEVPDE